MKFDIVTYGFGYLSFCLKPLSKGVHIGVTEGGKCSTLENTKKGTFSILYTELPKYIIYFDVSPSLN